MKVVAFLIMVSSQLALANSDIKANLDLTLDDSISLQDANIHLSGSQPTVGADGWVTYSTEYSSSDRAFVITCSERNVMGSLINQRCSIAVDSALSKIDVSQIRAGEVANVIRITLSDDIDISNLKYILQGLPFYQTSETVKVTTTEGVQEYPRFRIDCDSQAKVCQAVLFR